MYKKIMFVFAILVTSLYVMPVMAQDACEGQIGAAFGLCNAYCEAMDCDADDPEASDNACNSIYDEFVTRTGSPPPCEVSCPCFTLGDLQAGGPIDECGENLPGFPDLAGAFYTDGTAACSGINCAGASETASCAYTGEGGSILFGISPEDDADCRTLILANCDSPNLTATDEAQSASAAEGSAFIDQ